MKPKIYEKLLALAKVLHWLGKYDECNAITEYAVWLQINGGNTVEQATDLLDSTNDNPNLKPLHGSSP